MRSWIDASFSFASVVTITHDRTHGASGSVRSRHTS
jgi:hypothetical protein